MAESGNITLPVDSTHAQRRQGNRRTTCSARRRSTAPTCGSSRFHVYFGYPRRPSSRSRSSSHARSDRSTASSRTSAWSCSCCWSAGSRSPPRSGASPPGRVLAPLAEVTQTAQVIGETDDLSQRLAVHADDEVGQLATRFNEMLERLEHSRAELDESVRAQRQLVADASHELRTPVTSLRTNIEVLLAGGELEDDDRDRLLADVVEQSEELSALVSDLIELARGDLPPRLDRGRPARPDRRGVRRAGAAQRAARSSSSRGSSPVVVEGVPERLGARGQQPARQRGPAHLARRPGRGRRRPRRRACARPRRRHRGRGPAARVRPLLPRRELARAPGQRPRPGDRAPGRGSARRRASPPPTRPTAAPCSRCTCRRPPTPAGPQGRIPTTNRPTAPVA